MLYSVTAPWVVIFPMVCAEFSVNHRLPSGPAVMPDGQLLGVGTQYSVIRVAARAGASAAPSRSIVIDARARRRPPRRLRFRPLDFIGQRDRTRTAMRRLPSSDRGSAGSSRSRSFVWQRGRWAERADIVAVVLGE